MTILVNQNFEGTGFDNGETWITYAGAGGVVDPDYSTSPLRGSQSLRMKDDSSEGTYAVTKFYSDAGVSSIYGFFMFKILDYPSGTYEVLQTYNMQGDISSFTSVEAHEMIWISPSGVLQLNNAYGNYFDGSTALSLNTTYYVWFYFTRSTTSNGSGWVKLSTTSTIPATNEIEWSGGTLPSASYVNVNCAGFTMLHSAGYEYITDRLIVSTSEIGSVDKVIPIFMSNHRRRWA